MENKDYDSAKAILSDMTDMFTFAKITSSIHFNLMHALIKSRLAGNYVQFMGTSEFKTELHGGKIRNVQLALCISDADERPESRKFVYGLKVMNPETYIIIFVSDGLFIQTGSDYAYIRYAEIRGIKESKDQLEIFLYNGYLFCGKTLQDIETRYIIIKRDERNRTLIRPIRKIILDIIKAYDRYIPDDKYSVKKVIEERIEKISKTSPTHLASGVWRNTKTSEKFDNALAKYAVKIRRNDAIAMIDTSFFENGCDGLLFSNDGIAFNYAFEKVFLKYEEIADMAFDKKHKNLEFKGRFKERKDNTTPPSISDIYFNLDELKECIEEIQYLI